MRRKILLKSALLVEMMVVAVLLTGSANAAEVKHPDGTFVTVNGAKIWVETEGNGEPFLLIAGGPGYSHTYFHPYFSALANRFRVIYFDAFGRGKSDRAKLLKEYSFDRDVEDIEALRKALGLGPVNVCGHSYGGMVAQAYALKYPGSVKRLILADTLFSAEMWQANNDNCNYEIKNQYPEVWEKIQQLRASGLHSGTKEHQDAYGAVPLGLFYFYDASNASKITLEPGYINPDVYYTIAGDDADFLIGGDITPLDFRNRLRELKMPLLILAGRFDRVALPRYSVQFKTYAPQGQFVMFENSGHMPFIEESEKFFGQLTEFLTK